MHTTDQIVAMGKTIYQLSKRIARGGMAEIYLGKAVGEDAFQRICAIKRILPHYSGDKEFIQMFRDEAHICKRLQHANIVQVYDFTEVDQSYALIMEYVDGADLRTLLSACEEARIRLHIPMALYIAACSARGLHYAHTKTDEITNQPLGIVHRDISPQNILISYEGETKITDFGIADADGKLTETRPGVVKGKYSYMSPEQIASKTLDCRSDVFSLAIVLWECLAMKRLFAGQTEVETIRKVQNCEIPNSLKELNPDVDDALMEIVMIGLARDRKKRYQTAASFEKAILKYLHSRYSDFTASELGAFLKQILAKRRGEIQDDIKHALTHTEDRPASPSVLESLKEKVRRGGTDEFVMPKPGMPEPPRSVTPALSTATAKSPPEALSLDLNQARGAIQSTSKSTSGVRRMQEYSQAGQRRANIKADEFVALRAENQRFVRILLMVLAIGAIIGYFMFVKFPESGKAKIKLSAFPERVQIKVNGQAVEGGAYIATPYSFNVKHGTHKVFVSRVGYKPKLLEIKTGTSSEVAGPLVSLEKLPNVDFLNVKIIADEPNVKINIENGLFEGQTPAYADNLPSGISHTLVFTFDKKGVKRAGKCSFVPTRTSRSKIFTIKLASQRDGSMTCRVAQ